MSVGAAGAEFADRGAREVDVQVVHRGRQRGLPPLLGQDLDAREQLALLAVADKVVIPCRPSAIDARRALEALELVETVNRTRRKKAQAVVVMNGASRSAVVGHIRNELVAGGAKVLGSEVAQRTAYVEAELYGSGPCFMGRSAQKAADEIAAVTAEVLRNS